MAWPEGTQLLNYTWYAPPSLREAMAAGGVIDPQPALSIRMYVPPDMDPAYLRYELEDALRQLISHPLLTGDPHADPCFDSPNLSAEAAAAQDVAAPATQARPEAYGPSY